MSGIVVVGGINVDFVAKVPRFPTSGESVVGSEFFQAFGGKGANQAVAAARLGAERVTMIGAIGDDGIGSQCKFNLQKENVSCEHLLQIEGESTGVALIFVNEQGENCISVVVGANGLLNAKRTEALPENLFLENRIFLASLESPIDCVIDTFRRAKAHGALTILNPAPANQSIVESGVWEFVDILTPNESELKILCDKGELQQELDQANIESMSESLKTDDLTVVVTLGEKGCFVNGKERFFEAGRVVNAIDTTAAGDTFNGALARGLEQDWTLAKSVEFANHAASLSVSRAGAQPSIPKLSDLK